jgi:hypothetical protein
VLEAILNVSTRTATPSQPKAEKSTGNDLMKRLSGRFEVELPAQHASTRPKGRGGPLEVVVLRPDCAEREFGD